MEIENAEIIDLLDIALSEEDLNNKINDTQCFKSLIILLKLKRKRFFNGKSKKIYYLVHNIYEKENEDIYLQCEILKTLFSIIENPEEEILQIILYLNSQLDQVNNNYVLNSSNVKKVTVLLNEVILICKIQNMGNVFQEIISLDHVNRFLFYSVQHQNLLKVYILSTVLPNYINLLGELLQLKFLHSYFLQCKDVHNLDILCILFNYINKKALLTNRESILLSNDFWQYIEDCISCDIYSKQKQAIFLFKKCVQTLCDSTVVKCEIPYLQTTNLSTLDEAPKKIWQKFFILLEASKEKQLHLIWPSLTLLNSLKHVNTMWQISVYKRLLSHTQSAVVYFVATHIVQNNIFFPALNKYFLSAINKNEYMHNCTMFKELPNFCNNLKVENFLQFLDDILDITWIPTAAWCLFANTFTETLKKDIPFQIVEPIYKLLKQLQHIYIRNACISIFLNYFVKNYNWKKSNINDVLKLLLILKQHDKGLFMKVILNYIDPDCLNIDLSVMEENIFDIKLAEVFIQMNKILKYEFGIKRILESRHTFNKKLQAVIYANLLERFKVNDIEKFILEQVIESDEDCIELYLIIKKLLKLNDFSEIMYSKMLHILNKSSSYNKSTISIALQVILYACKEKKLTKEIIKDLKITFYEYGKTDDDLCIMFLELHLLTEECPEIPFLEHIIHNQSDVVISKMFEYLSVTIFHKNCVVNVINFLRESLKVLPHLTKTKQFKTIISNYINCIFSINFLKNETEMLEVITLATKSLLSISETFPIIDYHLSEKIKETILFSGFSRKYSLILIPIIEELLLRGIVIKKDDRVEYYVCQEIYEKFENKAENPNFIKISTRMSSLETMMWIISENSEYADAFTTRLMKKYRLYFNKRYFPDSQIHLQKLRIVQALLTIHPFIKMQRQTLINLIEESFCTEIHQPCVKQLMQLLLLALLEDQSDDYFNTIKIKIDTTSKTQPSTIVAFIVVLLHLTLNRGESYWFSAVEALIPWSMGAHFKLRVYSQAAIKKLLEEGRRKHYKNFLTKYSYLETSIVSVIEASGSAFYETLKSDELIFSIFEPEKYYSLETIYIDIPKLNGVTRTEWENISQYKFKQHTHIDTNNKIRLFSNSVEMSIENNNKGKINEGVYENTHNNIQRKINPWKNVIEEQGSTKQTSDFILICTLIDKSTNLGGLSRTCEVFGVKQLILNDTKILNDKEFKSLSMSSEDWVNAVEVKTSELKNYICEIRNKGYSVIGAEQTSDSICLDKYKFNKKTALVLGNEKEGIPPDIIPILDACIEIPQFGMVRSLNVHVAGATFIWEYVKQHLII